MTLDIRKGIVTKFLSPTNYRGARVKAIAWSGPGGWLVIPWDHSKGVEENHAKAAFQLADIRGWIGQTHNQGVELRGGGMPDDKGFMWVLTKVSE